MTTPQGLQTLQALARRAPLCVGLLVLQAHAAWEPVKDPQTLRTFMSGLSAESGLPDGGVSRGEYLADGTGTLYAWGNAFKRTWSVTDDGSLCIAEARGRSCYRLSWDDADTSRYQAVNTATGEVSEFRVSERTQAVKGPAKPPGNEGGAGAASADEIAAELSNPNTAVATLTFKNQFRSFEGDVPDASDQSSYTMLFQPALPFVLPSGDKVIWRPAVPLVVDQPLFDERTARFDGESGIGDIAMDLAYAPKMGGGNLFAFGVYTSLPTASNGLGTDRWTLGPEVLIGKATKRWVAGLFPNHQWDVAGSGDADINLTSIQAFFTYLPGGGWNVGSGPTMAYDWEAEQWTFPLQVNAGKTVVLDGRPWKLGLEVNYYVEKPDAFGPEWMISVNIAPVVRNTLADALGLGK